LNVTASVKYLLDRNCAPYQRNRTNVLFYPAEVDDENTSIMVILMEVFLKQDILNTQERGLCETILPWVQTN
jgi:hypothetical protein